MANTSDNRRPPSRVRRLGPWAFALGFLAPFLAVLLFLIALLVIDKLMWATAIIVR